MSNPRSHPPPRTCDNATNPFVRFVCDAGDDVFAGLLRLRRHTFCVKLLCRELRDRFPARTYTSPLAYCGSDAIEDWAEAHGCVFYDSVLYSAAISDATLVERLWGRGCVVTTDTRRVHIANACVCIAFTIDGIATVDSAAHLEKVSASFTVSPLGVANVTRPSLEHPENEYSPIARSDEGNVAHSSTSQYSSRSSPGMPKTPRSAMPRTGRTRIR